jgi:hypothetical protein
MTSQVYLDKQTIFYLAPLDQHVRSLYPLSPRHLHDIPRAAALFVFRVTPHAVTVYFFFFFFLTCFCLFPDIATMDHTTG